jgi:hypothetical protein
MNTVQALQPKVRLAKAGVRGAELYNFYQLTSLMASFYVKATECEDFAETKRQWDECSGLVVEQVGMAYEWWNHVETSRDSSLTTDDAAIHRLLRRSADLTNRCLIAEKYLNEWEFAERWCSFAALMERAALNLVRKLSLRYPSMRNTSGEFESGIKRRLDIISGLEAHWAAEAFEIQNSYREPVAL